MMHGLEATKASEGYMMAHSECGVYVRAADKGRREWALVAERW